MKLTIVLNVASVFAILSFSTAFGRVISSPILRNEDNAYEISNDGLIHVDRLDVTFRLWTRDHQDIFRPIYYGHLESADSIRTNKAVKVIIHGWTDHADKGWYGKLMKEYLKKDDINVIGVDWAKPASALYPLSVKYTKDVGIYVGELMLELNQTLGIPLDNIHLIGHSLGAHIAGFAGQYVQKNMKQYKFARITGLDPAGPLFHLASSNNRLSVGDANFVDVIHTDGLKLGLLKEIGDVDFYPNGGKAPQPGCLLYNEIVDAASCSHIRSYYLFGESINSNSFVAKECGSLSDYTRGNCDSSNNVLMGENVDQKSRGSFYLLTNVNKPYATN